MKYLSTIGSLPTRNNKISKYSFMNKYKSYKRFSKSLIYLYLLFVILVSSCSKYLDKTPAANITEADVFSTFPTFQGFIEQGHDNIIDWVHGYKNFGRFNLGGDDIVMTSDYPYWYDADYQTVISSSRTPYYNSSAVQSNGTWGSSDNRRHAFWQNGWFGIRDANIAISHLKDLVVATDEQRKFLEGEAYFYRGYFYSEIIRAWGAVPYVDTVLTPTSNLGIPVIGLYATIEKVVADLQHAADLLPVDWDATVTGQPTMGQNISRPSKGMALGIESGLLMFAASPLCNGIETGSYTYNIAYCKRAASAAWQVIQLANQGRYALEPWATYSDIFFRLDGTYPRSKEVVMAPPQRGDCYWFCSPFVFSDIGTDNWFDSPTENYVELFETATGLPINDPQSGFNPMDPWNNRDPRFRYNITVDRDRRVKSLPDSDPRTFAQLYTGGRDRSSVNSQTGFGFQKYKSIVVNNIDDGNENYYYAVPILRLAEVYLIYAEMANEAYGPDGKDPAANLTAVDAVNLVRHRAQMPDVNSKFLANTADFRARIWNERAVELAFESKRWYDIRRWHVATLPQYTQLLALDFDEAHTYFKDYVLRTVPFTERNYWLPFPVSQINLYPGWKQNPGW